MIMQKSLSINKKDGALAYLTGTLLAISITLILILVFALFIRFFDISNAWIFPVNQVIKIVSLFFGIYVTLKKLKSQGLLNGVIVATLYFVINYVIFAILQGKISFVLSNFYDLILTIAMGGLIGIIVVNIIKK